MYSLGNDGASSETLPSEVALDYLDRRLRRKVIIPPPLIRGFMLSHNYIERAINSVPGRPVTVWSNRTSNRLNKAMTLSVAVVAATVLVSVVGMSPPYLPAAILILGVLLLATFASLPLLSWTDVYVRPNDHPDITVVRHHILRCAETKKFHSEECRLVVLKGLISIRHNAISSRLLLVLITPSGSVIMGWHPQPHVPEWLPQLRTQLTSITGIKCERFDDVFMSVRI